MKMLHDIYDELLKLGMPELKRITYELRRMKWRWDNGDEADARDVEDILGMEALRWWTHDEPSRKVDGSPLKWRCSQAVGQDIIRVYASSEIIAGAVLNAVTGMSLAI